MYFLLEEVTLHCISLDSVGSMLPLLILLIFLSIASTMGLHRIPYHRWINTYTAAQSVCGRRGNMEDEYLLVSNNQSIIAAVFDGHGGSYVSKYLKSKLLQYMKEDEKPDSLAKTDLGLLRALHRIEQELTQDAEADRQGSTAAICMIKPKFVPLSQSGPASSRYLPTLVTANIGDSRVVLCRAGKAIDLTKDHKPDDPEEMRRIEAAGGNVVWTGLSDIHS